MVNQTKSEFQFYVCILMYFICSYLSLTDMSAVLGNLEAAREISEAIVVS